MPKQDIHPKSQPVSYVMLDGSEMVIESCYTRSNKMTLEIDIFSHQAWKSEGNYVNDKIGQVAKFKEKFGMAGKSMQSIQIETKTAETPAIEAPKAAPKSRKKKESE